MPLRLNEITTRQVSGHVGPDNWLEGRTRVFIGSAAFDIIKRDLRRYVDGEINGRSHLIAGHRGAGKTALVLAATDAVRFDVLNGSSPSGQRPLLVKLHGPSLFSGVLPSAAAAEAGAAKPPEQEDRLRAALAQITVALYRALASEVAETFRIQVIQAGHAAPDVRSLELAAQLNLELDNGSTAGVLRGFWDRVGCLVSGVLWPHDWAAVRPDQGMREIVAIATASQAFQVCIGAIDYKTTTTAADSLRQVVKSGVQLDAGPALSRLAGLFGGGALGGALAAGGVDGRTATVAGLAAGLLGATFSVSRERARDRSQSATYEFIRDNSKTTLDRDLPEVILRLRRAGLRPVFLVDELDKIGGSDGTLDQAAADDPLRELVDRLKNLTTDYGFFCFLTNRDYYEALRKKLRDGDFPREHTHFSNMHYVLCSASDQLRYVLQVLTCTLSDTDRDAPLHWMALAFAARLRSRMNVISLVRELNRHVDGAGELRPEFRALGQRPQYQLAASMQMVIDLKLDEPDVQARIADNPIFGQLVVDTLYRLPVALEKGEPSVDLAESDLTMYLQARSGHSGSGNAAIDQCSEADRHWLAAIAVEAALLLADFNDLGVRAAGYWTRSRQQALLPAAGADPIEEQAVGAFSSLIPTLGSATGLVRHDQASKFTFLMDRFCVPVARAAEGMKVAPSSRPRALAGAAEALTGTADAPGILASLKLTISYLKDLGVLGPAVPDETSIRQALARPAGVLGGSGDAAVIEGFFEAIVQASSSIAWAALLTKGIGAAAEDMATKFSDPLAPYSEDALRAGIARHIRYASPSGPARLLSLGDALRASSINLPDEPQAQSRLETAILPRISEMDLVSVRSWAKAIDTLPVLLVEQETLLEDPWAYWRDVVGRLFESSGTIAPISLSQLVLSARGVPPACLFRYWLYDMSVVEWSNVALAALGLAHFAGRGTYVRWAVLAALRQLGFDAKTLSDAFSPVAASVMQEDEDFLVQLKEWPSTSPVARVLYIIESSGHTIADERPPAEVACFAIRGAEILAAAPLLDILQRGGQMSVTVV